MKCAPHTYLVSFGVMLPQNFFYTLEPLRLVLKLLYVKNTFHLTWEEMEILQ